MTPHKNTLTDSLIVQLLRLLDEPLSVHQHQFPLSDVQASLDELVVAGHQKDVLSPLWLHLGQDLDDFIVGD